MYADVAGLSSGSAYQLRLRPVGALAGAVLALPTSQTPWYQWQWAGSDAPGESWPSDGYFLTGCTCDPYNPSGSPEGLNVTQVFDHMMFRWVRCLCRLHHRGSRQ